MTDQSDKVEIKQIKTVDTQVLLQDYLSEWQKDSETPLFRLLLDEEKSRELTEKERGYLRYYQKNAHILLISAVGVAPLYYFALRFRNELNKVPRNSGVLNRLVVGLLVSGSCSFGLFGVRVFRQYFSIHPDEGQLKTLHLAKLKKYDLAGTKATNNEKNAEKA
jgi:hypothetical protein